PKAKAPAPVSRFRGRDSPAGAGPLPAGRGRGAGSRRPRSMHGPVRCLLLAWVARPAQAAPPANRGDLVLRAQPSRGLSIVPFPRSKRTLYRDRPVGKRNTPAVSRRGSRFPWFSGLEADFHTELGVPVQVIGASEIAGTRLGGLTDAEEQRRISSNGVFNVQSHVEGAVAALAVVGHDLRVGRGRNRRNERQL